LFDGSKRNKSFGGMRFVKMGRDFQGPIHDRSLPADITAHFLALIPFVEIHVGFGLSEVLNQKCPLDPKIVLWPVHTLLHAGLMPSFSHRNCIASLRTFLLNVGMKIGILSDTHGNVQRTRQAAQILKAEGCQCVIHCGDIGSESVLFELAEILGSQGIAVYAILGNVDFAIANDLMSFPSNTGIRVCGRYAEIAPEGKSLIAIHGDDAHFLNEKLESEKYDYVLTGHTHQTEEASYGKTRLINPGAIHRTTTPTVAILDTEKDEVVFQSLFGA
jgi:putative phosphoesterase